MSDDSLGSTDNEASPRGEPGDPEAELWCCECDKTFSAPSALARHLRESRPQLEPTGAYLLDVNLMQCPQCLSPVAGMGRWHTCEPGSSSPISPRGPGENTAFSAFVDGIQLPTDRLELLWTKVARRTNNMAGTHIPIGGGSQVERATQWLRVRDLRRAMQALEDSKLAEGTDQSVLEKLKKLHPSGQNPASRDSTHSAMVVDSTLVKRAACIYVYYVDGLGVLQR
eukprot:gb/GECG01009024.1/.p1 GENE.gb/GECG01009024.1/~~gb/GECG01009024.1/.p1  ORF type:complete len:226 (+),score=13.41 gb/GECG01009024.1/:1-678(+)